jgi:hypothetical protein
MSGWTKAHESIKQALVGRTGVRVLVVEGADDARFFKELLDRKAPGAWQTGWAVGSANGKQNVLRILEAEPDWIGIVDRDEWSNRAVIDAESKHPNLHVLPRFCMESYFLLANELWAALLPFNQGKVSGGEAAFRDAIHAETASWVRHGALWHAVNPLWDGLRAKGFKEALLDLQAAQDDAVIQQKLREWHDHLEPTQIFADFNRFHAAASAESLENQLTQWVHGKKLFTEHVVPVLNRLIGQQSADVWFKDLLRTMPVPADLRPLWNKMNL